MKRFTLILCFSLLLLMVAMPVTGASTTISGDRITDINPAASQRDTTVTVTITGNNFTTTTGSARLEMSGQTDIDASITSWTSNTIICRFTIKSTKKIGLWDVVVVKGYDDTEIVEDEGFAIAEEMSLTSISPATAQAGDDDVDFTLTGKNFDEDTIEDVYLYNEDYDNITADDFDVESATKITGTFDLEDADEDDYEVCVEGPNGIRECDLSFEITTNEVGSIDIESSPSGASITIDGIANGTTPATIDDLLAGSHKILLRKSGYQEWGKMVTIKADETVQVDAKLYAESTATVSTTAPVYNPTIATTRVRTTAKSTIKVPTTWPSDTPATTASPVDPAVVIGAIGIGVGLVVLRRS